MMLTLPLPWIKLTPLTPLARSLALSLALTACATPPQENFYTLQPLPEPRLVEIQLAIPPQATVVVGLVTLPSLVDRPQWVVRRNTSEVRILEHQRWAHPLDEDIGQAIAAHLNAAGTRAYAQTSSMTPPILQPTVRVQLHVVRFTTVLTPTPQIDDQFQWAVSCTQPAAAGQTVLQRTGVLTPKQGIDTHSDANIYTKIAKAHADAVHETAKEIAKTVRELTPQCGASQ